MTQKFKLRTAIWAIAFETNSFYIVNAVMSLMIGYYTAPAHGGYSVPQIMMIASLPGITSLLGSLGSGIAAKRISQKAILFIANVMMLLQALLIVLFYSSYPIVLFSRVLSGIAQGLIMTMSGSLVATHCHDLKERDYVMGMRAVFQNGGGMFFSFFAGSLAAEFGWQNAFFLYLLFLIPILLAILFLPWDIVPKAEQGQRPLHNKVRSPLGVEPWVIFGFSFLVICACYTFNLNLAPKIQQSLSLGAAQSGTALMFSAFGGMITGFAFKYIYERLHGFTLALGVLLEGIAMLLIGKATLYWTVLAGSLLFGMGYALWTASLSIAAVNCAAPENRVTVVSLNMAGFSLGMAMAPWSMNWLSTRFYSTTASYNAHLFLAGVLCILLSALAFLVCAIRWMKNKK